MAGPYISFAVPWKVRELAKYNPDRSRRNPRLKSHNYARSGIYFITMVAHKRECVFGNIVNDVLQLNNCGDIVATCWQEIPQHYPTVKIDDSVVMPNHFHGLLILNAPDSVSKSEGQSYLTPVLLSQIVGAFKAAASKRINLVREMPGVPVWQRSYHERIIRNEDELIRIRRYIADNPLKWSADTENPTNEQPL